MSGKQVSDNGIEAARFLSLAWLGFDDGLRLWTLMRSAASLLTVKHALLSAQHLLPAHVTSCRPADNPLSGPSRFAMDELECIQ